MANVKMSDVAKAAGVSIATVGRVIHNNGYVAEDKRKEIEKIIADLGYIPNKIAQGLKSSRSRIIGHMTVFNTNMLFEQISAAVDSSAAKMGYHVLTLTSHRAHDEVEQQVTELIGHRVDGVIVTSNTAIEESLITRLTKLKIPVVMVERVYDLPLVDRVKVKDFEGSLEAVSMIAAKGHRRIGFIGSKADHPVEHDRFRGYSEALKRAGIAVLDQYIGMTEDYSVREGYQAMKMLMECGNPPTAVFMTSDIYACGALQYLYEKNIRVPEQVSLVGYDNTLSTLLSPAITSVGLPVGQIGDYAIEMLLERMSDYTLSAREVYVDTVLIDRGTVKKIGD